MMWLFLALSTSLWGQSSVEQLKWYLEPNGQEIKVDIDDLHTETLKATSSLAWGRNFVKTSKLQRKVKIAVIDGGVDPEHVELKPFMSYKKEECFNGDIIQVDTETDADANGFKGDCIGWNFVDGKNSMSDADGHGTHVSGVMASILAGHQDMIKILPLKVFADGEGLKPISGVKPLAERLVAAFNYAISEKVDLIHLSVGWPKSVMTADLQEVILKARNLGILLVAAAGNSSQRASVFPCTLEGVICVGALRANGEVAAFSNVGHAVDILAAGEKILSSIPSSVLPKHFPRRGYDYKNGTSQAAPMITAALAFLKSYHSQNSEDEVVAKLLTGASEGPIKGDSLVGAFNLQASVEKEVKAIWPMMKETQPLLLENGKWKLNFKLKNYLSSPLSTQLKMACNGQEIASQTVSISGRETTTIALSGETSEQNLECKAEIDQQKFTFLWKISTLPEADVLSVRHDMDQPLVIKTRTGVRSRLLTLNAIPGSMPGPLYYGQIEKNLYFYNAQTFLGKIPLKENCQNLRFWQADLNQDGVADILLESMCDKKYLYYEFYDQNLQSLFPSISYEPGLCLINYDQFTLITHPNEAPTVKFINAGFIPPSTDPWSDQVVTKKKHYYELKPVFKNEKWIYDVTVLDQDPFWNKQLGFRYNPGYDLLQVVDDKLLIEIQHKTVWIDLKEKKAEWANQDHVLWLGAQKANVAGAKEPIFNSLLSPFEYRGYFLSGLELRYRHPLLQDPILDVTRVVKNEHGFKVILRSFRSLVFIDFDLHGNLIKKISAPLERFDFLSAQDLLASVATIETLNETFLVSDATRIHTNYVEIFHGENLKRWQLPSDCSTQQPILIEYRAVLPLFCTDDKTHFKMKFIPLD
jgi:hypothetical protein